MSEPLPTPPPAPWKRPLAYLLLISGGLATFMSQNISTALNLSLTIVQIAALVLILAGAALFYSVREVPDRASIYRQAFGRVEPPPPPGEPEDKAPEQPE